MPCLYIIAGANDGTLLQLEPSDPVTIGRGFGATMQILDSRTSRVHCELTPRSREGGDFDAPITIWTLADCNSGNGTFIGDMRIGHGFQLENGMVFNLGTTHIVYLTDSVTSGDEALQRCMSMGVSMTGLGDGAWPSEDPKDLPTMQNH